LANHQFSLAIFLAIFLATQNFKFLNHTTRTRRIVTAALAYSRSIGAAADGESQ
jgi:hypothetical protein